MTKYVALLRGVTPSNPRTRNEKLRAVCEGLGLAEVQTVISSGNVVFEADSTDAAGLESTLEAAWRESLGFESTTIIRSQDDLRKLVEIKPFGQLEHGPQTYLLVTFSKERLTLDLRIPYRPLDRDYRLVQRTTREVFSVTDTTAGTTPDVMAWLEKKLGKQISSRTWLTVTRILARMDS
jgi:uncharacterized protein (DUF1697 family)